MDSLIINKSRNAVEDWVAPPNPMVGVDHNKKIALPPDWIPNLRDTSEKARSDWRLSAGGEGTHWEELAGAIWFKIPFNS